MKCYATKFISIWFIAGIVSIGSAALAQGPKATALFLGGLNCDDKHGCKVCSVFHTPEAYNGSDVDWRDTTVVPETWKPYDCKKFGEFVKATYYQLGCFYKNGGEFGEPYAIYYSNNGGVPGAPNGDKCKWYDKTKDAMK